MTGGLKKRLLLVPLLLSLAPPTLKPLPKQYVMAWPAGKTGVFELQISPSGKTLVFSHIEPQGKFDLFLPAQPNVPLMPLEDLLFQKNCRRLMVISHPARIATTQARIRVEKHKLTAVLTNPRATGVTVYTHVYADQATTVRGRETCQGYTVTHQFKLQKGWNVLQSDITAKSITLKDPQTPVQAWKALLQTPKPTPVAWQHQSLPTHQDHQTLLAKLP